MDVGATSQGYTADITRTIPVSGRFTARQREIYEIVLKAQQAAIDVVAPGARPTSFTNPLLIDLDGDGWSPPGL